MTMFSALLTLAIAATSTSSAAPASPPVPAVPAAPEVPDPPPPPPAPPPPPPFQPVDDDRLSLQIPWVDPSGEGIAFGYDNGSWGGQWSQGVRISVPFGDHVAANLRAIVVFGDAPTFAERIDMGGRLELIGRSPVFLNLMRLYGGGGVQLFGALTGAPDDGGLSIGGGGHFGFEFFLTPSMSWILEVGGQSGLGDGVGGGASIIAGLQLYPF